MGGEGGGEGGTGHAGLAFRTREGREFGQRPHSKLAVWNHN